MPKYHVKDDRGNELMLEGDSAPSEQEMHEIFSQHFPDSYEEKSAAGTLFGAAKDRLMNIVHGFTDLPRQAGAVLSDLSPGELVNPIGKVGEGIALGMKDRYNKYLEDIPEFGPGEMPGGNTARDIGAAVASVPVLGQSMDVGRKLMLPRSRKEELEGGGGILADLLSAALPYSGEMAAGPLRTGASVLRSPIVQTPARVGTGAAVGFGLGHPWMGAGIAGLFGKSRYGNPVGRTLDALAGGANKLADIMPETGDLGLNINKMGPEVKSLTDLEDLSELPTATKTTPAGETKLEDLEEFPTKYINVRPKGEGSPSVREGGLTSTAMPVPREFNAFEEAHVRSLVNAGVDEITARSVVRQLGENEPKSPELSPEAQELEDNKTNLAGNPIVEKGTPVSTDKPVPSDFTKDIEAKADQGNAAEVIRQKALAAGMEPASRPEINVTQGSRAEGTNPRTIMKSLKDQWDEAIKDGDVEGAENIKNDAKKLSVIASRAYNKHFGSTTPTEVTPASATAPVTPPKGKASTPSFSEMRDIIGKEGRITEGGISIPVSIDDVKIAYGETRYHVVPKTGGEGKWVSSYRFSEK